MVAMMMSMNARCTITDTPMAMAVLSEGHPGTVTVTDAAVVLNCSSSTCLVSSLTVTTDTMYVAPEIRSVNRAIK